MKKTLLILICLAFIMPLKNVAQTSTLNFTYDHNGNRILRELVFEEIRNVESLEKEDTLTADASYTIDTLDVQLFPNPTYGQFYIQITDALPDIRIKAILLTASGIIISEKLVTSDRMEFDLSNQAGGVYFLQLLSAEKMRVWKIIKK